MSRWQRRLGRGWKQDPADSCGWWNVGGVGRSCRNGRSGSSAEVGFDDAFIGQHFRARSFDLDVSACQHIGAIAEPERLVGHLFDQQDGGAVVLERTEDVEDARDDNRCEPERGLVEQQKFWAAHQSAGDRDHLLLTPAQQSGALLLTLLQAREQGIDPTKVVLEFFPSASEQLDEGAEFEILKRGMLREELPSLRHQREAARLDEVGWHALERPALIQNLSAAWPMQARNGAQERRLAGAIGAEKGDDLSFLDAQVDAAQNAERSVASLDVLHLKHGHETVPDRLRRPPRCTESRPVSHARSRCRSSER